MLKFEAETMKLPKKRFNLYVTVHLSIFKPITMRRFEKNQVVYNRKDIPLIVFLIFFTLAVIISIKFNS